MSGLDSRSEADFNVARGRALLHKLVAALSGHPHQLLVYDEVREKLRLGGPVYRGVQPVPLEQIIGSVNRYRDFDRLFLPTQSHTRDRWRRINRAWYQDISLPPVLLYKVGDVYFVVDGNHRVSVARSKGQTYIDAEVRECIARVPLTEEVGPEDLERLGERVEFLERSRLDRVRPAAVIETTLLGGYDRLIEHIAVHRYFMGIEAKKPIPESDAVAHWYDTIYQPVAAMIEESGILEAFPEREVADLYLWVMDHLHFLHDRPGQEDVDAVNAAKDFIETIKDEDKDAYEGG